MIYKLPNGKILDLGIYTLDDCIPLDEGSDQQKLAKELFEQAGILVSDKEGGDKNV